ncbi:MAG: cyanophycin synthetase [Patescibacteria group bacterium]
MKAFVSRLFKKLASRAGVKIRTEPHWQVVGQIITPDGKKRYFRNTCFDLNTLGATEIARDKDYANYFMTQMGYPVIPGQAFFSDKWCKQIKSERNIDMAYRFARRLGFPVFVKPNSRSQGNAVAKVHNKTQFYRAMKRIFKIDNIALVQKVITGNDYRIVVLDDKIISAYERKPLSIIGDGKASIRILLTRKQKKFARQGRDTVIKIVDPRIREKLAHDGLSLASVLPQNQKVFLLDNANLSCGGDAIDVTKEMHADFIILATRLTKDMGLRFCGVDIMVHGDIRNAISSTNKYRVIEINAAPGVDNYSASGKKQQKIVGDLYLEVLKSMTK